MVAALPISGALQLRMYRTRQVCFSCMYLLAPPPLPLPRRSLSLDNIITLLNGALLEKQVVVFCPHIGTLAAAVLALVPLLRPFCWQSLMMPVTPRNMLGFLEAPVPFLLGVQYKTPDVAMRWAARLSGDNLKLPD
jgi:hypothetical protein